jgi:hypothetical protein
VNDSGFDRRLSRDRNEELLREVRAAVRKGGGRTAGCVGDGAAWACLPQSGGLRAVLTGGAAHKAAADHRDFDLRREALHAGAVLCHAPRPTYGSLEARRK